ncbi:translocation/assembly module TamB domain-containing protein [Uliginosibacterium gangwonense]|uniref:translocation/assembly module TamB domain-containing protein n=1 Tax=Uliginosibacterium gangwonense TaxID=392736 RepID=UPI000376C272|nr:translocation/assembly module TamB domain-containing protein [Uliginosibacterium gangwonense]
MRQPFLRTLQGAAITVLAIGLSIIWATVAWIVGSESGGRFAAARVSAVSGGVLRLEGWHGRLLDRWQLDSLRFAQPGLQLDIQGIKAAWHPFRLGQHLLDVDTLHIQQVALWRTPSNSSAPARLPVSLKLPLDVRLADVQVSTFRQGSLAADGQSTQESLALQDIHAQFQSHRGMLALDGLQMRTPLGKLDGRLSLADSPPFALSGQIGLLAMLQARPARIDTRLQGSLAHIQAHLAAKEVAGEASGALQGEADVVIKPFEPMPLYSARLAIQGLNPAAFSPQAPKAMLDVSAQLQPRLSATGKNGPADWQVSGPIAITNHAPGKIDENALPVAALQTQLEWADGRLRLSQLQAHLPNKGMIMGELAWMPGKAGGTAEAALKLKAVNPAQFTSHAQGMLVDGEAHARGNAQAQQFGVDLAAQGMRLVAEGRQEGNVLKISRAELQAREASARFSGRLALNGSRAYAVQGEVERLDPHAFLKDAPAGQISASLTSSGTLSPAPSGQFDLTLAPSKLANYPLQGHAKARFSPGRLHEADVDVDVMGNRVHLTGAVGARTDQLQFLVDAAYLERLGGQFGGRVHAQGYVGGIPDDPVGSLSAEAYQLRAPGGWQLAELKFKADLQGGAGGRTDAHAQLRDLVQSSAAGAQTLLAKASVDLSGNRSNHQLSVEASLPHEASLSASASGGLRDGNWNGWLQGLSLTGPLRFALEKPATLAVSSQRVALGSARLISQGGEQGRIELMQTEWTPERLLAKGKLSGVQLGFSLDEYQRTVFRGRSLQLGAEWDVDLARQHAKGLVHVFREGGDFILQGDSPVALGLENLDLNAAIEDQRLALSALANGSRIGAFNAVATLALSGQGADTRIDMRAPMVGVLNADMPSIAWLGPFVDQNMRTSGSLHGLFNLTGTPENPVGAGYLKGEGLGIVLAEQGTRLDQGNMLINFDAARVRLENLSFRADNRMAPPDKRLAAPPAVGAFSGSGEIALPSGKGDFQFKLDHVAALQQPGQWLIVSGDAHATSTWDGLDINARLHSDTGFVGMAKSGAPKLSDDVVVRGRQKPPQRMHLNADIGFDFGDAFILKAYGVDTWLAGQLRIVLAQGVVPRATGSIRTRDGVFNAYGQRLAIERGAVNFHGSLDDPALNILALRKGLEVEAGVEVTGSAQRPKVRLVSDPNVPEQEKLAWILFGRASEGSAADIGMLLSSAGASLGSDGPDLSTRIANGIGLDSVSIGSATSTTRRALQSGVANNATSGGSSLSSSTSTTSTNAGDTMSSQVLTVGKRLSTRAYLSFEQNFLGTESVVKLSYALSRFVSVVARAGTVNGLDLNYSISFR